MDDMGDMEMDMESMMGGGEGGKVGQAQGNVNIVVLSNIEQSCRALQQMGMILSKFYQFSSSRPGPWSIKKSQVSILND